jgi:hypothetical protein
MLDLAFPTLIKELPHSFWLYFRLVEDIRAPAYIIFSPVESWALLMSQSVGELVLSLRKKEMMLDSVIHS